MIQKSKDGKLIIIVAPSGTGKSTLIKRLKSEFSIIVESVSFTTRPKRTGDIHGVHYFFISREEFESKISNGDFFEYATVHGNYYGTSKSFVEEQLSKGSVILFDLDVQGADRMKNYFKERARAIFIEPPSIEELESRLRKRATDSEEVIQTRVENARREIKRKETYDYCVLNDNLEVAYQRLKSIVQGIIEG